jgi:hypothetical protein
VGIPSIVAHRTHTRTLSKFHCNVLDALHLNAMSMCGNACLVCQTDIWHSCNASPLTLSFSAPLAEEYAVRDAAAAEAEAESRRIAGLDAKPELCAEKDGAPNDKVGGGAVTAVGSAEKKPKKSSTKQEEDAPSSSGKGKGRKSEGGDKAKGKSKSGGGADKAGPLSPKKGDKAVAVAAPITQQDLEWHMKLAPSCKFPEYPLPAAEGMPARMAGLLAKHRRPFYCPYYRLNGVIYASQGYHAVAPIVFKVNPGT